MEDEYFEIIEERDVNPCTKEKEEKERILKCKLTTKYNESNLQNDMNSSGIEKNRTK